MASLSTSRRPTRAGDRPAAEPILVVDDIVKRFETPDGPLIAVDHVSFNVTPGEFLSVIGPSGCGKSTLFNVIGGLLDGYDGPRHGGGRDACAGRMPRSAWSSRRSRPSPGAP